MNHSEWGEVYLREATALRERITLLRQKERSCPVTELPAMRKRITLLTQMYLDCLYTGTYLKLRRGARIWK